MVDIRGHSVEVRESREDDAAAIARLFRDVYGSAYVHPEFYDERQVKRMVFDEDSLILVAEDPGTGRIVGTGGVLFEMGAFTDLVGEFGRLAVHPEWRRRGIGNRLMEERLRRVGGRLHVGFTEVRVCSAHSPRISQSHGFVPVGLLPQKMLFGTEREHAALLVRHFAEALSLRKNNPRIIPEAHHLAELALRSVGVQPDVVIEEESPPYPRSASYELEELTEQGYSSLLRIERGRLRHREVFGPQRLHYGLFKLAATCSNYIVAHEGSRIVGALGCTRDDVEGHVRVFEVIHTQEDVIRFLLEALDERCAAEQMMGVEIDVSAHAPRMQRTLLEMGYLPAAYVPALAFDNVERVDIVKMYRLFEDLQDLPFDVPDPTDSVGRHVLDQFSALSLRPKLARAMESLDICQGLTEEQSARLLGEFDSSTLRRGEKIFDQGEQPKGMMLILEGSARVEVDGVRVGTVGPGESLGEVSCLTDSDHFASAIAETDVEVGVLTPASLRALVRRRPDIGTVVYRNLARGLGEKLRRADRVALGSENDVGDG